MKLRVFQSTHPHGVRPTFVALSGNPGLFQSTHPHGVRLSSCCSDRFYSKFQSTHPHGVRLADRLGIRKQNLFQSTHPHGVRHTPNAETCGVIRFNPRTRMGCDLPENICGYNVRVSIHAPAWGATRHWREESNRQKFQSTHPHGVRLTPCTSGCHEERFQSTHPHGVRRAQHAKIKRLTEVSIHAPAWGATAVADWSDQKNMFQSTHPHGVRLKNKLAISWEKGFNPRTRMGCD